MFSYWLKKDKLEHLQGSLIYSFNLQFKTKSFLWKGRYHRHTVSLTNRNEDFSERKIQIFGFDKLSVFTAKNLNTLSGDMTLRGQLKVPKDYLSTLATESGGSVFSQSFLVQSSRDFKTAASIFGRRVARTAVPNSCQVGKNY